MNGAFESVVFASAFTLGATPVTWLEIVAVALAVAMVVLNMRVDPRAWPLAIASSLLYFALFWHHRLYGDASLQLVFVVVAGWGWWQWRRGTGTDARPAPTGQATGSGPRAPSAVSTDPEPPLRVRHLPASTRWALLAAFAIGWPATALFLRRYTDTDVPWWDAFPTILSLIGQWLLGRKYVENWPTWVVVNVVSVGLFAYKGLWPTVALYTLFVAMSFAGWRAWRRLAADASR